MLTILSAPSILSATFDITNVRSYAPYDLFDADPNSFKKDVDFYFSLFDKSTAGRKAGHLPRNVDSAAQMQETLITPVKRTSLSCDTLTLHMYIFSFSFSSKVVEYMESMSYRQARESSRMKSSRGFSSLDEAESSARDQHAASIGEQVDLQDSIMKHTWIKQYCQYKSALNLLQINIEVPFHL